MGDVVVKGSPYTQQTGGRSTHASRPANTKGQKTAAQAERRSALAARAYMACTLDYSSYRQTTHPPAAPLRVGVSPHVGFSVLSRSVVTDHVSRIGILQYTTAHSPFTRGGPRALGGDVVGVVGPIPPRAGGWVAIAARDGVTSANARMRCEGSKRRRAAARPAVWTSANGAAISKRVRGVMPCPGATSSKRGTVAQQTP